MHLKVAAIGQRMPSWVQEGWNEYARRFPRNMSLELREIPMEKRGKNAPVESLVEKEAEKLLAAVPEGAVTVALDETGKQWSTQELSEKLSGWMSGGRDVWFMVGGPDGLHDSVRRQSRFCWSLGKQTLPHPLVRVILAEQLYRAYTVVSGHPYHRS